MGLNIPEITIENIGNQYGGSGNIAYEIVDPEKLTGHSYIVEFWDTSMDEVDNDLDGQVDNDDFEELLYPITTYYDVLNEEVINVRFDVSSNETTIVNLLYNNIIVDGFDQIIGFELYRNGSFISRDYYSIGLNEFGLSNGEITILNEDLLPGEFEAQFQYYPIFKNPYIQGAKWDGSLIDDENEDEHDDYDGNIMWIEENQDSEVFDGIRLTFNNNWDISYNDNYKWTINGNEQVNMNVELGIDATGQEEFEDGFVNQYISSNDLRISFFDNCVSCMDVEGIQTNFKIDDISRGIDNIEYYYLGSVDNTISHSEQIYIFEQFNIEDYLPLQEASPPMPVESNFFTWIITFKDGEDVEFGDGDVLDMYLSKPFRAGDRFKITTKPPEVDTSLDNINLSDIKVVPNPYIATTALESALPSGITSGRGERKIEFINLPDDAVIKIYNIRGQHIITLNHDGNIFDGSVSWNLRTKENMDIAYGVYLYVVESSLGVKKGKIAIIK